MSSSVIFADSADTYDTSTLGLMWDFIDNVIGVSVQSGIVGATNNCLAIKAGLVNNGFIRKNLPGTYSRLTSGVRQQIYSLPQVGYNPICSFWDSAALTDVTLYVDASGQLSVWYGDGNGNRIAQVGGFTAAGLIHFGTWSHIGFDLTWGTGGGWTIYVNSQPVLTFSGTTAPNDNNAAMFGLWAGPPNNTGQAYQYFDDIWVNNGGFIGDLQGLARFPNGAGMFTEWTIGGTAPAATNWQSVNEVPPNSGVTLVYAPTVSLRDLYTVGALPANVAQIVFVQQILDAQTDASGLGSGALIAPMLGNGVTSAVGGNETLNTNYQYRVAYWDQNPLTSNAPWAVSDWTTIQSGQQRIA